MAMNTSRIMCIAYFLRRMTPITFLVISISFSFFLFLKAPSRGPRYCDGIEVVPRTLNVRSSFRNVCSFDVSQERVSVEHFPFLLVHLGTDEKTFPDYAFLFTIKQIITWNPGAEIHMILSRNSARRSKNYSINGSVKIWIAEDIPFSPSHLHFLQTTQLEGLSFRHGFWRAAAERLYFVLDFLIMMDINEIIHLENDNMIYFETKVLVPKLRKLYLGLAALPLSHLEDGFRATAGLLYVGCRNSLRKLLENVNPDSNDMCMLGTYTREVGDHDSDFLPVIFPGSISFPYFSKNFEVLGGLFDAAPHGQFLGGLDPYHKIWSGRGFVNKIAPYRTDEFVYKWDVDAISKLGRFYITKPNSNSTAALFQIHVHSKDLAPFLS